MSTKIALFGVRLVSDANVEKTPPERRRFRHYRVLVWQNYLVTEPPTESGTRLYEVGESDWYRQDEKEDNDAGTAKVGLSHLNYQKSDTEKE